MSEVWDTKDGRRRVRRDPPTIEDAVLAAQGSTSTATYPYFTLVTGHGGPDEGMEGGCH